MSILSLLLLVHTPPCGSGGEGVYEIGPLRFLARWRKRISFCIGIVRLCEGYAHLLLVFVCVHVYVGSILLYVGLFVLV